MDNRTIDVVSEDVADIALAMRLIWPNAQGGKATHYYITKYSLETKYVPGPHGIAGHWTRLKQDEGGIPTLVLLWCEEHHETPLPFFLDLEGSIQFVKKWLEVVDYGKQPDHDGDNKRGWRLFTEEWGHVAKHHGAIVAVQPAWAMYGK
jgi:hypothetical protein